MKSHVKSLVNATKTLIERHKSWLPLVSALGVVFVSIATLSAAGLSSPFLWLLAVLLIGALAVLVFVLVFEKVR